MLKLMGIERVLMEGVVGVKRSGETVHDVRNLVGPAGTGPRT